MPWCLAAQNDRLRVQAGLMSEQLKVALAPAAGFKVRIATHCAFSHCICAFSQTACS
jgi:hypothetical protein